MKRAEVPARATWQAQKMVVITRIDSRHIALWFLQLNNASSIQYFERFSRDIRGTRDVPQPDLQKHENTTSWPSYNERGTIASRTKFCQ